MIDDLSSEQREVLNEFVRYVKNDSGVVTVNDVSKSILYDFNYGKGEAIELLNEHFYELIEKYSLTDKQVCQLAKKILRREFKWILIDDASKIKMKEVIFDGYGYVHITDGTRIDVAPDMYTDERINYNSIREQRLKNRNTNGREYVID